MHAGGIGKDMPLDAAHDLDIITVAVYIDSQAG
jgi:hypothetical protein